MLENKVKAVNLANTVANEYAPKLFDLFQPLVGSKIIKADGSLMQSVQKLIDTLELRRDSQVRAWFHHSRYSFYLGISANSVENGVADYHEVNINIGELEGQVLAKVYPPKEDRKTDYSADAIRHDIQAYKEAQKHADELKDRIYPFSETDR